MRRANKLRASLGAFLRTLCDLMLLNILWIVCTLPVVTIGPASSALCAVSLKVARGEPVATLRTFFDAFRSGFRRSLLLGLIGLAGIAVAVVVSAVVLSFWAWSFALHGSFENSLGGTIKNAFSLAFVEPGKTVLIWIAFAVPVLCALLLPEIAVIYLGWAFILFAVSAPAYFAARSQTKVFARFGGPAARLEQEEDNYYQ